MTQALEIHSYPIIDTPAQTPPSIEELFSKPENPVVNMTQIGRARSIGKTASLSSWVATMEDNTVYPVEHIEVPDRHRRSDAIVLGTTPFLNGPDFDQAEQIADMGASSVIVGVSLEGDPHTIDNAIAMGTITRRLMGLQDKDEYDEIGLGFSRGGLHTIMRSINSHVFHSEVERPVYPERRDHRHELTHQFLGFALREGVLGLKRVVTQSPSESWYTLKSFEKKPARIKRNLREMSHLTDGYVAHVIAALYQYRPDVSMNISGSTGDRMGYISTYRDLLPDDVFENVKFSIREGGGHGDHYDPKARAHHINGVRTAIETHRDLKGPQQF